MNTVPLSTSFSQRAFWMIALLCLVLGLAAFGSMLLSLAQDWQRDEYSHGYLIPLLAVFLACHLLAERRPLLMPSWHAIPWMLAAAFLLLAGTLAGFQAAAGYGFILFLTGTSLAFVGRAATRVLAPALAYLLFAVPLPHLVHTGLSQDLQLLSSTLGVWLLDLVQVPVFQEGNLIDLGGYKLQVVEACSGLRYLFPLLSFGYLVALLMRAPLWKRILIFVSAIPITIGMNSLRIALIGVTVQLWGGQMAEGLVHEFEGWTVFALCVLLLLAEAWLLLNAKKNERFHTEYLGLPRNTLVTDSPHSYKPGVAVCLFSLFMALSFGTVALQVREEIRPYHPPFSSFPLTLGEWQGRSARLEQDVLQSLQLSDYWMADYHRGDSLISLYVAYYETQRLGAMTHSPSACLPGGGWRIVNTAAKTIALPEGSITVTRLLIRREKAEQIVYYWFDERGRILRDTVRAKWYLVQDSILLKRSDGALVRLVTPVKDNVKESDAQLEAFLRLALPEIRKFVPGRVMALP